MSPQFNFQWFKENAERFSGEILFNENLSKYTWYRIGGPAAILATPRSLEDLAWLSQGIAATGAKYFILGAGSNLLISDTGFSGIVIRTTKLNIKIEKISDDRIQTGASVMVSSLLRRCAVEGWGGVEFLSGIPGTLGGVVRMNGGTHLGEAKDRLKRVGSFALANGSLQSFAGGDLKMEYRKNHFLPTDHVVFEMDWEIKEEAAAVVKSLLDETLARRKATQPIDLPSCGSVFKNPREKGVSAWQVIDQLGLRGYKSGGAEFSQKHSNFIVNTGGASAEDVKRLIDLAKSRAQSELGIELHEEVIYLGFHS